MLLPLAADAADAYFLLIFAFRPLPLSPPLDITPLMARAS